MMQKLPRGATGPLVIDRATGASVQYPATGSWSVVHIERTPLAQAAGARNPPGVLDRRDGSGREKRLTQTRSSRI